MLTWKTRAELARVHPLTKALFRIIETKQSNLCLAADFMTKKQLIFLADTLGPYIWYQYYANNYYSVLKTHIDTIEDFDQDLTAQLTALSQKHSFLIFETNAHPIPGDGIIQGLKHIGQPLGRGLLILAEMSTMGALSTPEYANKAYEMAERHEDFVMGFVGQRRLGVNDQHFVYMTPGVMIGVGKDGMGQQYRTVIKESGCDVIIVGRGIYQSYTDSLATNALTPEAACDSIIADCCKYRQEAWQAYLDRIK